MIVKENVIDNELAKELFQFGNNIIHGKDDTPVRFWTNKTWHETIVKDSNIVVCIQLPEIMSNRVQNSLEQSQIFNSNEHVNLKDSKSAMIYIWTKDSYIPEHTDGIYSKAVTVYLNDQWSATDGGLFEWNDGNVWNTVVPDFNLGVINNNGSLHRTTKVVSDKLRITLQVFLIPKPKESL